MAKTIEIRRHTDNAGDVLTPEGIRAALDRGARLDGDYQLAVSTGAQRATQCIACMLGGLGQRVRDGIVVEPGLRSEAEDRWRELAGQAGGSDLVVLSDMDAAFVAKEAAALGAALRRVLDALDEGGRALVVGHSPTNEAAVWGLTGHLVEPLGKGAGLRVVSDGVGFSVDRLP